MLGTVPALEPTVEDAFGQALLARLEGRSGVAIIERDDGFIEADGSDYFAPVSEDDELWQWIRSRIGQRILDVGAGAGRASVVMQDQGLQVTALDLSPGAINVCRQRGISETFLGTVLDLAGTGAAPFDTFLCFGANLGLVGRGDSARAFFDALSRLGGPDVRLLGTMVNPYVTEVSAHLAYHEANRTAGRPAGVVRIRVRYQLAATPWFELVWASPDELEDSAEAFGWNVVAIHETGAVYAAELRPK
jgi:SAM-dependent methyltransferase